MIIDSQIRSLQNFADKFSLTVKYHQFEDMRKRTKFVLIKNNTSISQPLSCDEMNIFLLGILSCKNFQI